MSKKKPKSYLIQVPVERASGWQYYKVTAYSEEQALELHKEGKSEWGYDEVEVTELGEPEVIEE